MNIEKIRGHKNKWCSNMYRSNRNKIWPYFSHKYDFFLLQRPYFSDRFLELCYALSRYPHTILLCQSLLVSLSPTNSRNWSYNKKNLVLPLKNRVLKWTQVLIEASIPRQCKKTMQIEGRMKNQRDFLLSYLLSFS